MALVSHQLTLNNIVIESRESDNFVNATQMCKAGRKQFNDWFRMESTKEFLTELENSLKVERRYHVSGESNEIQSSSTDKEVQIKVIDVKRVVNIKVLGFILRLQ